MLTLTVGWRRWSARWAGRLRARLTRWAAHLARYELRARYRLTALGSLRKARWETCRSCPHLSAIDTCRKCGCYMPIKVDIEKARCPLGKW